MSRRALSCCLALLTGFVVIPGYAADDTWLNPENLPPQLQQPLKLLATTAMSGEGKDFFSLQPGQTATIGTITGPAIIFRIWSTSSDTRLSALDMIVDGKRETLVAKGALPAGVAKDDPLRALDQQAYWSYLPVVVKKQAVFQARSFEKDVTEPMKFYLQVGYRQVPAEQLTQPAAVSAAGLREQAKLWQEPASLTGVGEEYTADPTPGHAWCPQINGPTLINGLQITSRRWSSAPPTPQQLQATRLVITCDGQKTIDVPLAALFNVRYALHAYVSAGTAVQGTTLYLRFPLPVVSSLSIGIEPFGSGGLKEADVRIWRQPLKAAPKYRLCAQYFSQYSVTDQPMTLLNVTGEGIFLGTNLCVDGKDRKTFAFLEGNEQIYIDGDTKPTIEGTGTEDYFNGAWYFEAGEKANLFSGVTFMQPKDPPVVDCYRYLVADCIPFKQSLRLDLQHGSRNKAPDVLYEGVNFWYQASPTNVAEPVAAKAPKGSGIGAEPATGGDSLIVRIIGFVLALVLVGFVAVWLLRRKT